MSETNDSCCPDCGSDRAALQRRIADADASVRAALAQQMAEGFDIQPLLDEWAAEGVDVSELLFPTP